MQAEKDNTETPNSEPMAKQDETVTNLIPKSNLNNAMRKLFWGFAFGFVTIDIFGIHFQRILQIVGILLFLCGLYQLRKCGKIFQLALGLYSAQIFFVSIGQCLQAFPKWAENDLLWLPTLCFNLAIPILLLLLLNSGFKNMLCVPYPGAAVPLRSAWLFYALLGVAAFFGTLEPAYSTLAVLVAIPCMLVILFQINQTRKKLYAANIEQNSKSVSPGFTWALAGFAALLFCLPLGASALYQMVDVSSQAYIQTDISSEDKAVLAKDKNIRGKLLALGAMPEVIEDLPQSEIMQLEDTVSVDVKNSILQADRDDTSLWGQMIAESKRAEKASSKDFLYWSASVFKRKDSTNYFVFYFYYIEPTQADLALAATSNDPVPLAAAPPARMPKHRYRDQLILRGPIGLWETYDLQSYILFDQDGETHRAAFTPSAAGIVPNERKITSEMKCDLKISNKGENQRAIFCMDSDQLKNDSYLHNDATYEDWDITVVLYYHHQESPFSYPYQLIDVSSDHRFCQAVLMDGAQDVAARDAYVEKRQQRQEAQREAEEATRAQRNEELSNWALENWAAQQKK